MDLLLRISPAVVLLIGCSEPDYEGRFCSAVLPCPSGFACGADQRCHAGIEDAGFSDAEISDAEPIDAQPMDARPMDAQPMDAQPVDTGPIDSGQVDSGSMDANVVDTGQVQEILASVASSSDDALEDPGGPMLITHGWVSLYSPDHWGATRFQIPNLPRGTQVQEAFIEVYVDSDMEDIPNVLIQTEPNSASPPLVMTNFDISGRPRSNASVLWVGADTGEGWKQTPDLSNIVQEVVDRGDWGQGSYLMFFWDAQGPDAFEFRQWDFDGAGGNAARLTIRY